MTEGCVIASRTRGNPKGKQNSKIKMQNDRAREIQESKIKIQKTVGMKLKADD